MLPQIIFSDVDGTFLNSDHKVLPGTLYAVRELQEKGIPFVIISARSPSGIRPILRENGFACPMICYSGALILDEDEKILYSEGFSRDWKGVEIQEHTQTKKFKSYPTPFSTRKGAADAFDKLFKKFANSILIVSYSSNSLPTQDEMVAIIAKYKQHVEVLPIDYKYSFGNQNDAKTHRNSVQEYLFVGY